MENDSAGRLRNNLRCCIVVYGCAKNQVDAEEMASRLNGAGYDITGDVTQADVVIVHTCGFIEDAKRESIEGIFHAVEATSPEGKPPSKPRVPVVVTGCLSQRYPDELLSEIPEIAGVAGTAAPRDIVEIVDAVIANTGDQTGTVGVDSSRRIRLVAEPGRGSPGGMNSRFDRHLTSAWTYLRISEGCRHHCTYCAIPAIRGKLSSRPEDEVIAEARHLASLGIREVNLIAQDLSDYGWDLEGRRKLPSLIRKLNEVQGIRWIRLLYVRPDGVDKELAEAMALPNVVPYIDLPIEHGSPRIMRLMGRPTADQVLNAVGLLRDAVPDLYLRTTVITGFPGETEKDVLTTIDLLSEIRPHRVGVFPFSREEGTPAYRLRETVPLNVARERAEVIRRFGLRLAEENGAAMTGSKVNILLERPSARPGYWIGRGPHQAPEVDGVTYVKMPSNVAGDRLVRALITGSSILTQFAREI